MTDHRHYWGDGAICLGCGVRRCRKWHCDGPRESGALCAVHAAQAARDVARPMRAVTPARTVHVLTYSLPGASIGMNRSETGGNP